MLSFYPRLRKEIDVEYVEYYFTRPRSAIVELLGAAKQDPPVLVVGGPFSLSANIEHGSTTALVFISRRRKHRPLPRRAVRNWFAALSDRDVVKSCLNKSIGWL